MSHSELEQRNPQFNGREDLFTSFKSKNGKLNLSKRSLLVIGLSRVARTETIEDYLKNRVNALVIIALSSVYAKTNDSRCTYYCRGKKIIEFPLFTFRLRSINRWVFPPITLTSIVYPFAVLYALLIVNK